jgi:hypothetical protein
MMSALLASGLSPAGAAPVQTPATSPAKPTTPAAATAKPAATAVRAAAPYEPPDGSVYHGLCLTGYWSPAEFDGNLARYRTAVTDRPLVLHSWFAHAQEHGKWRTWHWMNDTPDGGKCAGAAKETAELSRKHGSVPVIAWTMMNFFDEEHSPRLQDLTAGKLDWYLDDWIEGVKEFKDPIFIRPSHEMDGDWYPYSEGYKKNPTRNTAADYVAYWKYVVDRFRKAGATNVAWVWCVNGDRSGGKDWPDYYPGDDYVDWLGIDVYSARNPRQVIGDFVGMYGKTGKPIMIPEGGTGPEQTRHNPKYAGDAAWVKELFDTIEATPRVKALCWFQYGKAWDVERDAGQLAEYKKRIAAGRYGARFVGGGGGGGGGAGK